MLRRGRRRRSRSTRRSSSSSSSARRASSIARCRAARRSRCRSPGQVDASRWRDGARRASRPADAHLFGTTSGEPRSRAEAGAGSGHGLIAMQPLVSGVVRGRTADGVRFAFEHGWQCRRVRARRRPRPRAVRAARWLARAAHLDDRAGRRRRALGGTRPARRRRVSRVRRSRSTTSDDEVALRTAALRVAVRLRSLRPRVGKPRVARPSPPTARRSLPWSRRARRRAALHGARSQAIATSGSATRPVRSTSTAGACARSRSTRSATTRETSDPLYKHWPFLIARDAGGDRATASSTTRSPTATFDLGCEHDNYHGFYRYCEIEDGDLDYYLFVGPAFAMSCASSPSSPAAWRSARAGAWATPTPR